MKPEIRKIVTQTETTLIEGGKSAAKPLDLYAAGVVIQNPWAGQGYVEDLQPAIQAIAPNLGVLLTEQILKLAGSPDNIEAYGKAVVVGLNGEIEHGCGLIHTLRFGNNYRKAVGAKSFLASTNVRGPAGMQILMPLAHKHDEGQRSHFLTMQFAVADAPGPDEILIVLGAANGGRPHHRIGDRYQDLAILGDTDITE